MNIIDFRKKYNGLFEVNTKVPIRDSYSLSLVYTPGVGRSCTEIHKDSEKSYEYTNRANSAAIITDCSNYPDNFNQVCAIPELEAKVLYYKEFAGIDAYPIIVKTKDINKIAEIIENLMPNFSGYDFTGFSAERSILLEKKLNNCLKAPALFSHSIPDILNSIDKAQLSQFIMPEVLLPAIMRGAIDVRAFNITKEMISSVYDALTLAVKENLICKSKNFNLSAMPKVALYAAKIAIENNNTSLKITPEEVETKFIDFLLEGKNSLFNYPLPDYLSKNHTLEENSIELHRKSKGVIEINSKASIKNYQDYQFFISNDSIKAVSKEIELNCKKAMDLTVKGNLIAIVSDGSAVLGFGNIGADAALPVMEGKSALFKTLGGVDAVPICLKTQDSDQLIDIISNISPIFGGINLEDISSPSCFKVEQTLINTLDIPVFHDDQHGTAVVVLAGFLNALKLTGKSIENVKVVVNGAGAGAISVSELILQSGVKNLILCDTKGAIYQGRQEGMNPFKEAISHKTNPNKEKGKLADVIKGSDFFIGLSVANIVTQEMVKAMANKPVVFALANPTPEIMPDLAKEAGAFIVATGRSDFKNQINNSLAFPGIFRGALDVRAIRINNEMKVAASNAIANLINENQLNTDCIIPHALDLAVPPSVAKAVAEAAIKTNVAKNIIDPEDIYERTKNYFYDGFLRNNFF
jgi:malate dehydrogenase (oxaloacetate-decarboxylating)